MDTELAAQLLATYRQVARAGATGDLESAFDALVSAATTTWCVRDNYPDVQLEVVACEQIDSWACAYFLSSGPAAGEFTVEARTFQNVDGRWRLHSGVTRMSSTKRAPLELVGQIQRRPRLHMPDRRTQGNPSGPVPSVSELEQRSAWLTEVLHTYDSTPPGEWGGTIVSTRTFLRPSGAPGVPEDDVTPPDAVELARVTGLAQEAATRMAGIEVFASQATKYWEPFWVARTAALQVESLSSERVRALFGGSLWSDAVVESEPMNPSSGFASSLFRRVRGRESRWVRALRECEGPAAAMRYERALRWFLEDARFEETAVVSIGGGEHPGANTFPRFFLGRTSAGSVAGVVGVVVDNAGGLF